MSGRKQKPKPAPQPGRNAKLLLRALVIGIVVLNVCLWFFCSNRGKSGAPAGSSSRAPYRAEPDAKVFRAYAGSQSCGDCHAQAAADWANSHHALAERALDPVRDQAAFAPARTVKHGTQTSEVRLAKGRFEMRADGLNGQRQEFPIDRVIGMDPLRQFLIPAPGGRYQVTEIAMDPVRGDWFDVFGDEDRRPGEWGHWTGRGMTWNVMCAGCHNTRLRKNFQPAKDTYATAMAEMGVGCEACHGPMADHVAWQRKHPQPAGKPPTLKDPTVRRFDRDQMLDTCGSCHARRAELTGDFHPGERFLDHYSLTIPDETDVYYPDGQVRDEDYEFASFLGSRMHGGGVRCWDCHNVHSGKVATLDNLLCMRCHNGQQTNAPVINVAAHSFHKPGTSGDRCVDCHMPLTPYMQRHLRRDHGYTIPDPLLTKQHSIPNACNRCHHDKSVDWALETVGKWYGQRMERFTRARAQTVAQARTGQAAAVTNLVKLAQADTNAVWRAIATGLLKRWCDEPAVTAALLDRAGDTNALVRAVAARSLEPLVAQPNPVIQPVLKQLLEDPARVVRVEAAWTLRTQLDTNAPAAQELFAYLEQNADMPSALMQAGVFDLDRGATDTALASFRKAISLDAGSPALRHALAVALSQHGKTEEAVRELETACRLAPRDPEYRFKLGLALNEAGRMREALAALEEAVKLDPQFAQAWYNLGLAYSAMDQQERALDALGRAEKLSAGSAQIPYARATILARLERMDEARAAAQRALELQPSFSDAAILLQMLSAPRK